MRAVVSVVKHEEAAGDEEPLRGDSGSRVQWWSS